MALSRRAPAQRLRVGRRLQAGRSRALWAGVEVAAVLAGGSVAAAALLRLATAAAGPAGVAGPLALPASPGGASPASVWAFVFFQNSLVPHPLPGTGLWTWGAGSLLVTAAGLAQAFRAGRDGSSPWDELILAAPTAVSGAIAAAAEVMGGEPRLLLALGPLCGVPVAAAALAGRAWIGLRARRAVVPILRGLLPAAFAVAAGICLAALPLLALAPAGGLPPGIRGVELLPFAANAVVRLTFSSFSPPATAGLAAFATAGVLSALHLRARSKLERLTFLAALAAGLVAVAAAASPSLSPAATGAAALAAVPGALLVGAVSAAAGPRLESTSLGHLLASTGVLRTLGDRLPPPPAPELTARDMVGAEPDANDAIPTLRPDAGPLVRRPVRHSLARRSLVGGAVVAAAVSVVLVAVAGVAYVTLTAPAGSAPELAAARAYLEAWGANDPVRLWAALAVETDHSPAAPRLLSEADLERMLALPANRHAPVSAVQLDVAGHIGDAVLVRARYQEAGASREQTLRVARRGGGWRVLITPAAIAVDGIAGFPAAIDGVTIAPSGAAPAAVLPGTHVVTAVYPPPFTAGRAVVVADRPYPDAVRALVLPGLDDAAAAAVHATIASALRGCATSIAPHPARCPQSVDSPGGEAVHWTVVGDPAMALTVAPDASGAIVARGVFQMVAAYDVHIPDDVKHVAVGGVFRAPLAYANGSWSIAGPVEAGAAGAPQPSAAAGDLVAAVRAGFQKCAGSRLLRPADCPQRVPSVLFVKDVAWKLDADPTAGAATAYDARRATFTVTGGYSMSVTYTEGGEARAAQSSGRYRADLFWDGSRAVLVSINRA